MPPVFGFMGFPVPEVQCVPDAFCPEGVAYKAVVFEEDVFFSYDKNDLQRFDLADELFVLQVGDEQAGHIVIYVIVAIAFEEVAEMFHGDGEVVSTAQAYHFMKKGGIFKGEVGGVECAEAAAGGYDGGVGIFLLYEGEDFVEDVFFVLQVPQDTFGGVEAFGIKAFLIDAVDAPDLDGPGFDLSSECVDDMPVFIVEEAGCTGGEEQYGISGVAEDQQFHVPLQVRAEPFIIFSFHDVRSDRYCSIISFHKA